MVSNTVPKVVTDIPHALEPGKKTILDLAGQVARGLQGLLERSH